MGDTDIPRRAIEVLTVANKCFEVINEENSDLKWRKRGTMSLRYLWTSSGFIIGLRQYSYIRSATLGFEAVTTRDSINMCLENVKVL